MEHIVIIGNGISGVTVARHIRKLSDKKITIVSAETDYFAEGDTLQYDKLVIATGSKPNKFGWPGQDLDGVQGLYSKQDLDMLEKNAPNNKVCERAVIVGGGLIGIELAEMLNSRSIPVTFLVRETSFWNGVLPEGESAMINRHIQNHHIDLRLGVNLKEIKADENGKAKSIVLAYLQILILLKTLLLKPIEVF